MIRLAAIACLLLAGCGTNPPVHAPVWSAEHRNACVPEAAAMAQGLRGAGIQAHVLLIYTPSTICSLMCPEHCEHLNPKKP